MIYEDFDLLRARAEGISRAGAELLGGAGHRGLPAPVLGCGTRELPPEARSNHPRRPPHRIDRDDHRQELRGGALQRGVRRRRAGLFAQRGRRSQAREHAGPPEDSPGRSRARRSSRGVSLQPCGQPVPCALSADAARQIHGAARGHSAGRGNAAHPRTGDDLQPVGLSGARRRGGVDTAERIAGRPDLGRHDRGRAPGRRDAQRPAAAASAFAVPTSFISSATANSTRRCRKALLLERANKRGTGSAASIGDACTIKTRCGSQS